MNINPILFYPLSIGLLIFTYAFFRWPKYAIAGLIIAKPIIDITWDNYIIFEVNFLKLYAGLFVLLGIIYIIIKKISVLSYVNSPKNSSAASGQFHAQHSAKENSSPFRPRRTSEGEGKGEGVTSAHQLLHSFSLLHLLWLLFIASTFISVFHITGFHYFIVQLKYLLSVANGFIMFILVKNIFDFEKDKGFFIKTFLIAGIFPILLWLIPIILGTQVYSNDELLRVQGPYQNFWQFAFAGLQTLIFCLAYLWHCACPHGRKRSAAISSLHENSSPFRQRRTSEGEGKACPERSRRGEGVTNSSAPAVNSSASGGQFHAKHKFKRVSANLLYISVICICLISCIMLYKSYSKAFWLAGFLVLVFGLILMRKYILAAIVPVIIAVLFIIPPFNKDIKKTFSNEIGYYVQHSVPKQRVLRGRVEVWKQALRQYLELPFFKRVFGMGITQGRLGDDGIENDYIRVFVEQGFIGLLVYLGLLVTLIVVLLQRYLAVPNPIALAALLSVIALLILSIGANPLLIPNVQWLAWSSAGFALARKE